MRLRPYLEQIWFHHRDLQNLLKSNEPMARFELATFRLQGECSSQAELHWHEVK